ncbi:MAG: phosphoribosylanthranilate isomerase [Chitinispirillaceae bacterium]|jgi:phosphoribosylanthranilate isomerase|nr:phosphoribosylanthranilate isomerase [Chitinispirillaceae bacterium]
MQVRIKICGITRYEDAKMAAGLGADALGFIFSKKSPRYIAPEEASLIIRQLPPFISRVGVFVDEEIDTVIAIARLTGIDTIQLHGTESPRYCSKLPLPVIKAFSIAADTDLCLLEQYHTAGLLLDTWDSGRRGGTGKTFDWTIARTACTKFGRVILSGGLNPANLAEALTTVVPYGVDLNSGVEIRPGIKNPRKVRDAIQLVRAWERGEKRHDPFSA